MLKYFSVMYYLPFVVMLIGIITVYNNYGVLYTFTESDSSSSYFEGITLLKNHSNKGFLLTDESYLRIKTLKGFPTEKEIYTSNPWVWPRITSAALHLLNITKITVQNFILCLFSLALIVFYISNIESKHRPFVGLVFLFLSIDYLSGIRFYTNMALIWYFVILASLYYFVFAKKFSYARLLQASLLSGLYVLIYYIWIMLTGIIYGVILQRIENKNQGKYFSFILNKNTIFILFICILPIILFTVQLYAYYGGFNQILTDFIGKLQGRASVDYLNKIPFSTLITNYSSQSREYWMSLDLIDQIRHVSANMIAQYGYYILSIAIIGLMTSIKSTFLDSDSNIKRICLFSLTSIIALLTIMLVFRGSFYMLYIYHSGPLVAICVAQLFALGILSIIRFSSPVFKISEKLNIVGSSLIPLASILILAYASMVSFSIYTPIIGNPFKHLESGKYKERSMTSIPGDLGLFIFSVTGINPAYIDKPTYSLCVDNWRMRRQRGGSSCASIVNNFHQDIRVIHSGPEWSILKYI